MNMQKSSGGFEYKNKEDETPFETFLRYTNEKERSAVELASILQGNISSGLKLLDIGAGNGEYLDLALSKLTNSHNIELTLVEPSDDLVGQLVPRFKDLPSVGSLQIIHSSLEDLTSNDLFDVILMSHLFYHVPRVLWTEQLAKALSLLKPRACCL